MIRIAYAFVVAWMFAFAFAPALLLTSTPAHAELLHQPAEACYGPHKTSTPSPVKARTGSPHHKALPLHAKAATPTYSKAQLAYVSKWTKSPAKSAKLLTAVHKVAKETGLPPTLLLAVIKPESGFNPTAKGRGYHGLMQVSVKHHRQRMKRLRVTNVYDVEQNVRLGADIILDYRRSAKGNLRKALVKYTGGSTKAADQILRDMRRIPS